MAASAQQPEAKKGEEDVSMEEILQSIRKIIADDDPAAKNAQGAEPAKVNGVGENVPGSEVLELTEMVKDDGSVESLKPSANVATPTPTETTDILSKIDQALAVDKPTEPKVEPIMQAPTTPTANDDAILSSNAAASAMASLQKLQVDEPPPPPLRTTPSPAFRSGSTVEDMVADMLRPMMKEWLDANLPAIVERIVEREVKHLTRR